VNPVMRSATRVAVTERDTGLFAGLRVDGVTSCPTTDAVTIPRRAACHSSDPWTRSCRTVRVTAAPMHQGRPFGLSSGVKSLARAPLGDEPPRQHGSDGRNGEECGVEFGHGDSNSWRASIELRSV